MLTPCDYAPLNSDECTQEAAVRAVKHAMESTALPGVLSMVPGLARSMA